MGSFSCLSGMLGITHPVVSTSSSWELVAYYNGVATERTGWKVEQWEGPFLQRSTHLGGASHTYWDGSSWQDAANARLFHGYPFYSGTRVHGVQWLHDYDTGQWYGGFIARGDGESGSCSL
jgi:hypothetical protein